MLWNLWSVLIWNRFPPFLNRGFGFLCFISNWNPCFILLISHLYLWRMLSCHSHRCIMINTTHVLNSLFLLTLVKGTTGMKKCDSVSVLQSLKYYYYIELSIKGISLFICSVSVQYFAVELLNTFRGNSSQKLLNLKGPFYVLCFHF